MKRMIMLAALLLVASGCATTAQTQSNKAATPSQNTNSAATANTAATPKMAETASDDDAIAREKKVWEMLKSKDYDGFASMLADDQVEVSPSGVNDKAASVAGVKGADLSTVSLSDFKVVKLNDGAVLVTYLLKTTEAGANPGGYRESTVWVNRGGKWLAAFHQGTPVAAPSPQPK